MKILMIGNICRSGWYLKKGLEELGHEVILICEKHKCLEGEGDFPLTWTGWKNIKNQIGKVDIVHIHSPNFKKILYASQFIKKSKLIFHWHGSDLRHPIKRFPLEHRTLMRLADYNLYSTFDLQWFIKRLDKNALCQHFRAPVDTEMFKPMVPWEDRAREKLVWGKGALTKEQFIPHNKVPEMLNQYKYVECYPNDGVSPHLVSVSAMESASCGCKVVHHPYMNRQWVIENAGIKAQALKLLKVYHKVLGIKKEM